MEKTEKRIFRSSNDRVLGGVCGGLGEYFEIDPIIFRVLFVVFAVFSGGGIIIYLILWLIIPEEADLTVKTEDVIKKNAKQMGDKAKEFVKNIEGLDTNDKEDRNNRLAWGILFIGIGFIFFFRNFFDIDIFSRISFENFWPIIIIILGLYLIFKKK